ncbi:hypothetical protein B0H14DRAFT_3128303 [Mycena olivaceomarginata]|nr:hypothetical protein B0H14DRAFT_3128303 [Mycena olivaceomarginata]
MHPSSPADRARFLRHRRAHSPGTQAIRVSSASRLGIRAHRWSTSHLHGIMERTLHYILGHVVHSPLSLSPCRSCSPPPPLTPPHLFCAPLPRPSCMRRLCPPCSDPMHHASLTPLHALAVRAFPSHTMRGPHLHPLELHISCNALAQKLPSPSSSHLDTNPSIRLCYFQSSTATIPFSAFPILDFYVSACSTLLFLGRLHPRVQSSGESVRVATHPLKSVYIYLPTAAPKPSNTIIYLS